MAFLGLGTHCLFMFCWYFVSQPVFFFRDISVSFLLGHFGHWNILVICLTVVLKLAIALFISLNFQTLWPNSHIFFQSLQKHFSLWPKKKQVYVWTAATPWDWFLGSLMFAGQVSGFIIICCVFVLLQPLRWCFVVECTNHHERNVCEEKHPYISGTNQQ